MGKPLKMGRKSTKQGRRKCSIGTYEEINRVYDCLLDDIATPE